MSGTGRMVRKPAAGSRRDVNADAGSFAALTAAQRLSVQRASMDASLSDRTNRLPTAASSVGSSSSISSPQVRPSPISRLLELHIVKAHEPNLRGQPVELKWRVPIDSILCLRARDGASSKPQLSDPTNSVTSHIIPINGVPFFIRLTRIMREDIAPPANNAHSSPSKAFEQHVLSCHLVSGVPASGSPTMPNGGGISTQPSRFRDGADQLDAPTDEQVQQIERQSWERKVAFLTEIAVVPRKHRAVHPVVGPPPMDTEQPSRIRRVVEGVLSANNRSIGFSSLVPLRELLYFYVATRYPGEDEPSDASDTQRSGTTVATAATEVNFVEFTFRVFVSHAWQECISRHNLAASVSRQQYNLVGLKNHGSTCYINVLLQSLFHISFFRREVMSLTSGGRRKSEAAMQLQRIFYDLEHSSTPVDTIGLLKAIKVNPSIQNDTHEFLSEFFLHRVLKSITEMFSFKVKYLTTCQDVDFTSSSEETLFELSLCVGPKYQTLEAAVKKEFTREPISDLYDTGVHDFGKQKASRQMFMVTFPPILFLHSKRFDHYAKKVHTSQTFPLRFEVAAGREYCLYAVIVHHGTGVNSGHFTSYIRIAESARCPHKSPCSTESAATAASKAAGDSGSHTNEVQSHKDTPIPTTFFHFDDEAVYAVPTAQVLEEVVGVHWSNPSSSAYILIYIEADSFVEATTNFDQTPAEVQAMVEKMNGSACSSPAMRPSSRGRSPPPLAASPLPTPEYDASLAAEQVARAPTSIEAATPPKPLAVVNRRLAVMDASDMPRLLSACRELRECDASSPPRTERQMMRVTVWSIAGLRDAMSTLGVVHDLVDMRYAPKYIRQESLLRSPQVNRNSADDTQAPAAAGGVEHLENTKSSDLCCAWGTSPGTVCSLLVPYDTTISELRSLMLSSTSVNASSRVFSSCHHFSSVGEPLVPPPDGSAARACTADLFAFLQRRNGTWRPGLPVFDAVVFNGDDRNELGAFETPRRENDSVFSVTAASNISGTFTVRKRAESASRDAQPSSGRRCPPPAGTPPESMLPVTVGQLCTEIAGMHAHHSDVTDVMELHLFASSNAPVQHLGTSDNLMSPLTSQVSATPLHPSSHLRAFRHTGAGAPSSNASALGGVDRTSEIDDQVNNASLTSFGVSGQEVRVGAQLPPTSTTAFEENLDDAPALTHPQRDDSPLIIAHTGSFAHHRLNSITGATSLCALSSPLDCGHCAMLLFKAYTTAHQSLSLMGSFYVPLDWTILQVVVTLLQCGYLDWAPLNAQGIASFRVQNLLFASQRSSWTSDDRQLLHLLQVYLKVFEEVRPERLDAIQDWGLTIEALGLDHGDLLVIGQHAHASPNPDLSAADTVYSDEEEAAADQVVPMDRRRCVDVGASIARALVNSCRRVVVGCTLLSPLWGTLTAGSTVFCLVDMDIDAVALESMFLEKLREVASTLGADPSEMRAFQRVAPQADSPRSSSTVARLPNTPSPQHIAAVERSRGVKGSHCRWSWWCVDTAAPTKTNVGTQPSGPRPSLNSRARVLKQVSDTQLAETNACLKQTSMATALQIGSSSAPIGLMAAVYPSICTTLLQWGEWIFPTNTPQHDAPETAADMTTPQRQSSRSPGEQHDESQLAGTEEQSPAPLFDVSASMASQNFQMPWKGITAPTATSLEPLSPSTGRQHRLVAMHPTSGFLSSVIPRVFVDLRLAHQSAPPTITVTAAPPPSMRSAVTQKKSPGVSPFISTTADIVILWFGWCKAAPTHRFRLRAVDLSSSAVTVFSLAAQFLGILDGARGSCVGDADNGTATTTGRCLHEYRLMDQLALAVIGPNNHHSSSSAMSSSSTTLSPTLSDTGNQKSSGGRSGLSHVGVFKKVLPLISLLALHDAHGCTAPPLRSDFLVADLFRILGVHALPNSSSHSAPPVVEFALLLLPNAPMDMEESFRRHHEELASNPPNKHPSTSRKKHSHSGDHRRCSLLRHVDVRRSACMLTVSVLHRNSMQSAALPGMIPASDTLDELRLWLDQLYPARQVRGLRDAQLLLEVHVPTLQQGIHPSIHDLHDVSPCDYWLSRDVHEYCQRLCGSAASKRSMHHNHHQATSTAADGCVVLRST